MANNGQWAGQAHYDRLFAEFRDLFRQFPGGPGNASGNAHPAPCDLTQAAAASRRASDLAGPQVRGPDIPGSGPEDRPVAEQAPSGSETHSSEVSEGDTDTDVWPPPRGAAIGFFSDTHAGLHAPHLVAWTGHLQGDTGIAPDVLQGGAQRAAAQTPGNIGADAGAASRHPDVAAADRTQPTPPPAPPAGGPMAIDVPLVNIAVTVPHAHYGPGQGQGAQARACPQRTHGVSRR